MDKIIIVGAGHAGGKLTRYLFENNFQGEVLLFGDENYEPYERPPLSKSFLSSKKKINEFSVFASDIYHSKNYSINLNKKIFKINLEDKKVYDYDGTVYNFDKIVFANGASPKKISINNSEKVNYLRTIDDSIQIKSSIEKVDNLVILGAGFIGLEIASTIRQEYPNIKIHVIDSSKNILQRNSNNTIRNKIFNIHKNNNINFYFNNQISEIVLDKRNNIKNIVLSNQEHILADMIVIGIGVQPNTEIIENSKIDVQNGIKVNEYLQSNSDDVYAIGDIANYKSIFKNDYIREESWNNAEKQSFIVSQNIFKNTSIYNEVPWFWTDQFGSNFQILGEINNYDNTIERVYDDEKSVEFYFKNNQMVGAFAQNMGRDIKITREIIKKNINFNFDLLKNTDYNLKKIIK